MRGTMLWFNEVKGLGFILTEEGERLPVRAPGFAGGIQPQGRCAETVVTFEINGTGTERQAENVTLVPEESQRRARLRNRGGRR